MEQKDYGTKNGADFTGKVMLSKRTVSDL